jgi:IstB-like ATP binding protein
VPAALRDLDIASGCAAELRSLADGSVGMSAPVLMRDLIVAHTRALKLPGVARVFEGLARQERDAHWPHEDYLHEVLSAEQAVTARIGHPPAPARRALPRGQTLDTFDFTAAEGVSATQIHALARGE